MRLARVALVAALHNICNHLNQTLFRYLLHLSVILPQTSEVGSFPLLKPSIVLDAGIVLLWTLVQMRWLGTVLFLLAPLIIRNTPKFLINF